MQKKNISEKITFNNSMQRESTLYCKISNFHPNSALIIGQQDHYTTFYK